MGKLRPREGVRVGTGGSHVDRLCEFSFQQAWAQILSSALVTLATQSFRAGHQKQVSKSMRDFTGPCEDVWAARGMLQSESSVCLAVLPAVVPHPVGGGQGHDLNPGCSDKCIPFLIPYPENCYEKRTMALLTRETQTHFHPQTTDI